MPVVEGASVVDSTGRVDAEDVVGDETEEVSREGAEVDDVETVLVLSSEVGVGVGLASEERP